MSPIGQVGVVGCGQMGSGIAEVCARAGVEVKVVEANSDALERGKLLIAKSIERAKKAGKITEDDAIAVSERISFDEEMSTLADCEIVFEAVAEVREIKYTVFQELDKVLRKNDAILASNTSSIPIIALGMATTRPENVIGVHFFNPVPVMQLVEIIPSIRTSSSVTERSLAFVVDQLKKLPVEAQDRAGFITNKLLIPFLLSAIRMYEMGGATAEAIDTSLEAGCAHPMGPLRLSDFIGLDTVHSIAAMLYDEYKEPLYAPPPLLSRMVEGGLLGRKSGEGFYRYPPR